MLSAPSPRPAFVGRLRGDINALNCQFIDRSKLSRWRGPRRGSFALASVQVPHASCSSKRDLGPQKPVRTPRASAGALGCRAFDVGRSPIAGARNWKQR